MISMLRYIIVASAIFVLFGTIIATARSLPNLEQFAARKKTLALCKGEFKGRQLTQEELNLIRNSKAAYHRRADLCGADLRGANLSGANLEKANLSGANLEEANLSSTKLNDANLSNAKLRGTYLCQADLKGANLCGADLDNTNLTGALLTGTDLRGIKYFSDVNLSGSDLTNVNLSGVLLWESDLSNTYLAKANLSGARLVDVNFTGAWLSEANLSRAKLLDLNNGVNLSGANLGNANLRGALLSETNLSGTNLKGADLSCVLFQPKTLPDVDVIAYAMNLELMCYGTSPNAMFKLRKAFKEAGFYEMERKITYAIKHCETMSLLHIRHWSHIASLFEGAFNYVFFDLTTRWGMSPGRALLILIILIPVFAPPYIVALQLRQGPTGIWRKWDDDRIQKELGRDDPVRLCLGWRQALFVGFYFSLLSAFNIGWRELTVGNWIQRLQVKEYTLRPSGWVRTVSAAQALISVYLLAICILTYFGRPFE